MDEEFRRRLDEIDEQFRREAEMLRSRVGGLGPAAVIALWERDELSQDDFDTTFWQLWCDRVDAAESLADLPLPVQHYYASRFMEWEVGNGGFAQAAFNIPELFEPAARGYEALDLPACGARIREAQQILERNRRRMQGWRRLSIGRLFRAFARSPFARLQDGLEELGWWAEDARLAYVRKHKAAFADPDEVTRG